MKTRKLVLLSTLCFGLLSCAGDNTSDENSQDNSVDTKSIEDSLNIRNPEFVSPIRPNMTDFEPGEVFEDILEFDTYDHNFDYLYSVYLVESGEEVYMIEGPDYEPPPKGSKVKLKWTIELFDEAGDDYSYYDEMILGYEMIEEGEPVRDWLYAGVIDDLLKNDLSLLNRYLHEEQDDLYISYNPGAHCVLGGGGYTPEFKPDFGDGYSVVKGFPKGDPCMGYGNATPGFYYEVLKSESDLPQFSDMSSENDEFQFITPPQPYGGADATYKIIVITDYHYATIYAIDLMGSIYLWLIDYCDCSA